MCLINKSRESQKSIHNRVIEQSLPRADVLETGDYGKIAWYFKYVLSLKND